MYSSIQKMSKEELIGNFVYEMCLTDIWCIPFDDIYNWSERNGLNIVGSDIYAFINSCSFELITTGGGKSVSIPRRNGKPADLEYLQHKYRINLQKHLVDQIKQSIHDEQTHVFDRSKRCSPRMVYVLEVWEVIEHEEQHNIMGVFSTFEEAESCAKEIMKSDKSFEDYEISEWTLDCP